LIGWFKRWRGTSEGGRFQKYTIYYGSVSPSILDALKRYDLVVLEPHHLTADQVRELREAGTFVIGYLSVMEWPEWNETRGRSLADEDFLHKDGRRVHLPEWNSYLMDLRRPQYRELLLREIEMQIAGKGMDGVILDTVGDIDDYVQEPLLRTELIHGYLELLSSIRAAHPQLWLMQNGGFSFVSLAAGRIQAFLWEDWRDELIREEWVRERIELLKPLQKNGLRVFTVNCVPGRNGGVAAEKLGFVHCARAGDYSIWDGGNGG